MDSETSFDKPKLHDECQGHDLCDDTYQTANDYFIERAGEKFAGVHLIIDCLGSCNISSLETIERCLRDAVVAANATLLHIHLHKFTENGGVSGVAVLAESHITIHSWPENDYAALDVFMCGSADPHQTIDVISQAFDPSEIRVQEILRGKGVVEWNDGLKKNSTPVGERG